MKRLYLLVGICFVFLFLSCSSDSKDLIVGKWEGEGAYAEWDSGKKEKMKGGMEFSKDGTLTMTMSTKAGFKGKTVGEYKFIDNNHLEIKMEGQVATITVSVSKDELIMTDKDGKATKYRRVK